MRWPTSRTSVGTTGASRPRNVWKIEKWLIDYPHRRLGMSDRRYERLLAKYRAFKERWPDRKPVYYSNRRFWM